jgi:acetyl-CoA C-acetyltransferase
MLAERHYAGRTAVPPAVVRLVRGAARGVVGAVVRACAKELTLPEAVIVATARSPIGRANKGSLKELRPDDLTAQVVRAALDKVPALDPHDIEDLLLGCGLPGGESGNNMARVVAVLLGLDDVPGATLTRYCSSSIQTTRMAFHAIKAGESDVIVSAGVETVSRYVKGTSDHFPDALNPAFAEAKSRTDTQAQGGHDWHDPREDGELPDVYMAMGQTAENLARLRGLTRQELDEFGVRSQNLAEKAIANGFWAKEITPVTLPDGSVVDTDDGPRPGVTLEAVSQLKPVFRPDGVVTAGNCCPLNDGAAAVVVMSDTKAAELGLTPLARIVSTGLSALSPEIMGLGPVESSRQALARAGMTIDDIDLVEINEAFAAQVVPSYQDLGIDLDKLNVNGGAIAVGHPFGMTGARLQATMVNSLQSHDKQLGLISLCVGGGQGMALVLERLS